MLLSCAVVAAWAQCDSPPAEPPNNQPHEYYVEFDFATGAEGFSAGFADYPAGREDAMSLDFAHSPLPAEIGPGHGLRLSGLNHSDDLFMFVKTGITGLEPSTTYEVRFELDIASNAPDGSVGIGGSPGNGVCVKAGVTVVEPTARPNPEGYMELNIDKGNQLEEGLDMTVLGDIAMGGDGSAYAMIQRSNAGEPFVFTSDASGDAWLVVGTDSGFEGMTTIYLAHIEVSFIEF